MTLVNYAYHTSVTDSKDFLSKLRTFASAQGWTVADYQTSVTWGAGSGWVAGSEDFLQMTSSCYGSCTSAVYRLTAENNDADEDYFYASPHESNVYQNIGTHPHAQDSWQQTAYFDWTTMPSSAHGIPKMWLFGNQNYIYVAAQYPDYGSYPSSNLVPIWHFGTIDHYPEFQSRTDGAMFGTPYDEYLSSAWYTYSYLDWFCGCLHPHLSFATSYIMNVSQSQTSHGACYNWWWSGGLEPQYEYGEFNFPKNVLRMAGYSGRRPGFKADYLAQNTGTGQLMPVGKTPFRVIPYSGLSPGEDIDDNGNTWRALPLRFRYANYGVAFRIA